MADIRSFEKTADCALPSSVCAVERNAELTGGIPPHGMLIMMRAKTVVSFVGTDAALAEGDVLYIKSGTEFSVRDENDSGAGCNVITFDVSAAAENTFFLGRPYTVFHGMHGAFDRRFDGMTILSSDGERGYLLACASLWTLITECQVSLTDDRKAEKKMRRLKPLTDAIGLSPGEEWTLDKMCLLCGGISKTTLISLFEKAYGITPTEYTSKIRVKAAMSYLRDTDMSIKEICSSVGCSVSYFYRIFAEQTGMPPEHFRRSRVDNNMI